MADKIGAGSARRHLNLPFPSPRGGGCDAPQHTCGFMANIQQVGANVRMIPQSSPRANLISLGDSNRGDWLPGAKKRTLPRQTRIPMLG